jgi:sporulation protein YlmC with PRC-barrel domain
MEDRVEDRKDAGSTLLTGRDVASMSLADPEGRKVGAIRDVVLERESLRTRYLVVDLGLFRKQVLVPVEEVAPRADEFGLLRWGTDVLKGLPAYAPDRSLTPGGLEELARAHPRAYGDLRDAPPAADTTVLPIRDARGVQLPREAPDLRGWTVFGSDGERAGMVTEMLVDTEALKVSYLDVDLLQDLYTLEEDRHVLVPIEAVDLKDRGQDVWLRETPARALSRLPAYPGGPLDPALEPRIRAVYSLH